MIDRAATTPRQERNAMSWIVTGGAGYIGAHVVGPSPKPGSPRRARRPLQRRRVVRAGGRAVRTGQHPRPRARREDAARPRRPGRHPRGGIQVRRCLGAAPAAHLRAERRGHPDHPRGDGGRRSLEHRLLVFGRVFGTPDVALVVEDTAKKPASPYGESKLIGEWLLRDQAIATADSARPAAGSPRCGTSTWWAPPTRPSTT